MWIIPQSSCYGGGGDLTSRIWYGSTVWTLIACPAPMPSCFPGLPSVESGNPSNQCLKNPEKWAKAGLWFLGLGCVTWGNQPSLSGLGLPSLLSMESHLLRLCIRTGKQLNHFFFALTKEKVKEKSLSVQTQCYNFDLIMTLYNSKSGKNTFALSLS